MLPICRFSASVQAHGPDVVEIGESLTAVDSVLKDPYTTSSYDGTIPVSTGPIRARRIYSPHRGGL